MQMMSYFTSLTQKKKWEPDPLVSIHMCFKTGWFILSSLIAMRWTEMEETWRTKDDHQNFTRIMYFINSWNNTIFAKITKSAAISISI